MLPLILFVCVTVISANSGTFDPFAVNGASRRPRSTVKESTGPCLNPNSICVKISECDKFRRVEKDNVAGGALPEWTTACGSESGTLKICCEITASERTKRDALWCGIPITKTPLRRKRITGNSRKALLGAWPWMAALYYRTANGTNNRLKFYCGATLISSEWVLTAAHCVSETKNHKLAYVRLGDLDIDKNIEDGASPIEVNVTEIRQHPQYAARPVANNIALLRLSKPVEYTEYIRPICVRSGENYSNESYYSEKKPVIIGWGSSSFPGGDITTHLREADVAVVKMATCSKNYADQIKANQIKIDQTSICANTDTGNDSCQGDSGGPLMFQEDGVWWIGGISSQGLECGRPQYPGIYTKVASHVDWIRTTTGLKF